MSHDERLKPWTRNLFRQFCQYQSMHRPSPETSHSRFSSVNRICSPSQHDKSSEKFLTSSILRSVSSQPVVSPKASSVHCTTHRNHNHNENLLLLADSTGKELYMNKLIEKFEHVEGNLTKSSLMLEPLSTYSVDEVDDSSTSETSNTYLEYVSQQHSKGEVVAKEALKIMQQMYRKLYMATASSSSNRLILRSIRQKWASYTLQFHEMESRFKESVSEMIFENKQLKEKLCLEETSGPFQTVTASNSQLHCLYEQAKVTGNQILELHRDLNELNSSYQEFHCLVLDQGSAIDDIWYNLMSGKESLNLGIERLDRVNNSSFCSIM